MNTELDSALPVVTPEQAEREDPEEEYIMIPKVWMYSAGVGLLMFLLGGMLGYWLGSSNLFGSISGSQSAQVAAPVVQPTAVPARLENVSVDDDPFLGPADALVTMVEFSDYQCPFCKRFRDETLDALFEQYGDQIRFVYRDFPISSIHADAQKAAEAAECVREQDEAAYWQMHDLIFANQVTGIGLEVLKGFAGDLQLNSARFNQCLDSGKYEAEVLADLQEGQAYGVTGTPTFFINGVRLVGAQPLSAFQTIIDQELNE
jgi:protein-disulfide isomerase